MTPISTKFHPMLRRRHGLLVEREIHFQGVEVGKDDDLGHLLLLIFFFSARFYFYPFSILIFLLFVFSKKFRQRSNVKVWELDNPTASPYIATLCCL
jgi:hypothetical protein